MSAPAVRWEIVPPPQERPPAYDILGLPFVDLDLPTAGRAQPPAAAGATAGEAAGAAGAVVARRLLRGDNLEVMRRLAADPAERFHLIYLDPPFGTGQSFQERVRRREGFEAEPAYEDRWPDLEAYLDWLRPRLEAARQLLAEHGSLVVHLDWRTVHHVKVLLDGLFGARAFVNEIVWLYNGGAVTPRAFSRKHDTLLWYVNGPEYTFRRLRRPYKANTQAVGRHSTYAREVRIDLDRGTPLTDWWDDIPTETGWAREVAYPTAKPKALLERLLRALTNPGDRVADFFAGSGTLAAACERLAAADGDGAGPRAWTLCDRSRAAWRTMLARLWRTGRAPYGVEWAGAPCAEPAPAEVQRVGDTVEVRLVAPDAVEGWSVGLGDEHAFWALWASDRGTGHRRESLQPAVRVRRRPGAGRLVVRILAVDGRWWWLVENGRA
ncbi:MAG: site-specific DNA-methyltransferase [Firmicutes bacterium]|nr:site-specific DNA-methyltransferase [Bacillota bacterium]